MTLSELITRYETMLKTGENTFFDLHELVDIAQYYETQGEISHAIAVLEYALTIYPGNVDLLSKLALCLYWTGEMDRAYEIITTLPMINDFAIKAKADILYGKGDKEDAKELIFKLLNDSRMDQVDCLEALDILCEHGQFNDALDALTILISRFGYTNEILEEIYFVNGELELYDENAKLLNDLLDKDPYNIDNWCKLARTYGALQQTDKAVDACEFALAIEPENDMASNLKAFFFYEARNYDKAIEIFNQLFTKDPENYTVLLGLGDCYWAKQDYANALKFLKQAIDLDDIIAEVRYMAAYCAFQLDMFQEALDLIIPVAELPGGNDLKYKMLKMDLRLAINTPIADIYEELTEILAETQEKPNQYWLIKAYCDEYLKDYEKAASIYLQTYKMQYLVKLSMYRMFLTCNDMHNQGELVMSDDFIDYINENNTMMEETAYELLVMPETFNPSGKLEEEIIEKLTNYVNNYEPKH
ncbi:MAG: tetratricopeptide repeat protein [Bacteroidales bacterium]